MEFELMLDNSLGLALFYLPTSNVLTPQFLFNLSLASKRLIALIVEPTSEST